MPGGGQSSSRETLRHGDSRCGKSREREGKREGERSPVCKERECAADKKRHSRHMQPVNVPGSGSWWPGGRQVYNQYLVLSKKVERILQDVVSESKNSAAGLTWVNVGATRPMAGHLLTSVKLEKALLEKASRTTTQFSSAEYAAFGIPSLVLAVDGMCSL
jgi:hypothetical protein